MQHSPESLSYHASRLRPEWAGAVVALLSLVVAMGLALSFYIHIHQVRRAVQGQNSVRLAARAERVGEFFSSIHLNLSALAIDEDLVSLQPAPGEHLEEVFALWFHDWQASALLGAPKGYKAGDTPSIVISGHAEVAQQAVVQKQLEAHDLWFASHPEGSAQISEILNSAGEPEGWLYSVPVLHEKSLKGQLGVIVSVERIMHLLDMSAPYSMALLTNENNMVLASPNYPKRMQAWFEARLKESGSVLFFKRFPAMGELMGYKTHWMPFSAPYGQRDLWWLVHQYDEAAALRESGVLHPLAGYASAVVVGFLGLLMAWLLRSYLRGLQRRRAVEGLFNLVAEGVLGKAGEEFFGTLVQRLGTGFGVPYVMVSERKLPAGTEARTLAVWARGEFQPNFTYNLKGSPCESVLAGSACMYPKGIQALFPEDTWLVDAGAQSYQGAPLISGSKEHIGVLALIGTEPMSELQEAFQPMLRLLASRAASELERVRAEAALQALVASTTRVGQECFQSAASALCGWLGAEVALIGELLPNGTVEVLAGEVDGRPADEMRYTLAGSPCQAVAESGFCYYRENVRAYFPGNEALESLQIQGYTGVALSGHEEKTLGLVCVMSRAPISLPLNAQEVFSVLAARLGAEMERRATQRRERLLEAQLYQSQKMEAIGRLAGGIAHDFNNLLQAIQGYGDLALAMLEPEHPSREALTEMLSAGERAAGLVRQLLGFSRGAPTNMQPLDLDEAIAGVMKMIERVLGEDIAIEFTRGKVLPPVLGERGKIEQVLMNLCVNARDAMPGGGRLTLHTQAMRLDAAFCELNPWARPGDFVRLSVADSGEGISQEVVERIFEPFFTTKEADRGTGLGLSTVYGIVEQHQGFLRVYSEIGQGTVFHVYLPVTDAVLYAPPRSLDARRNVQGTETILYAEDEAPVRTLVTRVLGAAGYTVLVAANGDEAIAMAKNQGGRFSLAVLDVIMPVKGGRAVADYLRQHWPEMPILFCSGYSGRQLDDCFAESNRAGFLEKPFAVQTLLERVRELLDTKTP